MRKWLRKKRQEYGYTQEEIAFKANISQNHYSAIETGIRNPSVVTAKKIAEVLGFDWTLFFNN